MIEASRGGGGEVSLYTHRTGCAVVPRQSVVLSSATQHAMLPEQGGKWEAEYFNTKLTLPRVYGLLQKGFKKFEKKRKKLSKCEQDSLRTLRIPYLHNE